MIFRCIKVTVLLKKYMPSNIALCKVFLHELKKSIGCAFDKITVEQNLTFDFLENVPFSFFKVFYVYY